MYTYIYIYIHIYTCIYTFVYNPAKPSGRGGDPPPGWEGDLLVL